MMQGYKVSYIPGWDCHGLPIELKTLEEMKKMNQNLESVSPVEIRSKARLYAERQIENQKKEFMRWGIMGDWDHPYKTMDPQYEAAQLDVFYQMYKKGLIYRGYMPVYWSPSSKTALAEAELEYFDNHKSTAAYILFPVVSAKVPSFLQPYKNLSLLIWTTTPWTIPANKALCVHNDLDYCIVKYQNHTLIIAAERISALTSLIGPVQILQTVKGNTLVGLVCQHPFIEHQQSPVLHGDYVVSDSYRYSTCCTWSWSRRL